MKLFLLRIFEKKHYLLVFLFIFIILLSIYSIKGFYSRYAVDDYCYSYRVIKSGFWNTQIHSYFFPTEYNSNRYSSTFVQSLVEIGGGPSIVAVIPFIEIIFFSFSLCYLFFQLIKEKNLFVKISVAAISALGIIFFTFYLAGNLYQILFWLPGIQSYLTPMVLNMYIFSRLLALSRISFIKNRNFIEVIILSLFAGGFSETTTLWMFVILCLILVLMLLTRKHLPSISRNAIKLVVTACLVTGLALIILIICPANYYRSSTWIKPDLLTLIRMSLFYGEEFIINTILSKPLPFAILACLGFWLGIILRPNPQRKINLYIYGFLISIAVLYILSVTTMIPTEYSMSAYPGERALFPAHFSLIIFFFGIGWLGSRLMINLIPRITSTKLFYFAYIIVGIGLFFYIARTIPYVYDKMPLFQARAQAWDTRNQMIINEKVKGQTDVTVPQFDSVYGISDLMSDSRYYINVCAAKYYGIRKISAIENYLGYPVYSIAK